MKVKVTQQEDFHFIGTSSDFNTELLIDATPRVGGKDRGFRPPFLFLYSMTAGLSIHLYEYLHEAGKHVENIETEADWERRSDYPRVFTKTIFRFRLEGRDLESQDIYNALEMALNKTCSLAIMLNQTSAIACEFEVLNTDVKGILEKPAVQG